MAVLAGPVRPGPGKVVAIRAALTRFQRGDDRVPRGVRPVIEESWQRSLRSGVDPVLPRVPLRSEESGRSRTPRNQELLEASHAVMAQARTALTGCGTMLMLADAAGVLLRTDGDDNALADADGIGLTPGSTWSEVARGTCGIGTSLYLGDALYVHGPEHYCREHQSWTCSASVVRDPVDDRVLGALSVGGPSAFDPHLFPLVLASAASVRSALAEREDLRRERLLEHAFAMLSRRPTTGLMLFDRRGRLVTADARARSALAVLGAVEDGGQSARLAALDVCANTVSHAVSLPFWLRERWLEPVLSGDERIGTIVKFPAFLQIAASQAGGLPRYKLRRVMAYVDARIGGPICLDDLATVAGVSRFHFHRQFRKSVGTTPHDYVLRVRIERAKSLLIESDLTVGEVSGAVGFVDQSHFSNIFRKLTEMTPRTFRNSMSA